MLARLLCHLQFCLLTVGVGHSAGASSPPANDTLHEPRFESIGVGAIPRDVVAALAQDKAGLIWIATGDGLVRFDGYQFRAQERASPDPAQRNLGWIRALLPASDGRLWIGTENHGLAVYDPATESVHDFGLGIERDNQPQGGARAPLPTIRALAEDKDGNIWVGSIGAGVARFDIASSRFTHFRQSGPGGLPDDRVQALLTDRNGTVWVGTWNGLGRLLPGSDRFETVAPQFAGRQIQALHEASDGRIWVGTQSAGLAVIDAKTAQRVAGSLSTAANRPGQAAVSVFAEASGGVMWVGTDSGVDIYDSRQQLLRHLQHDIRNPSGLAGNEVTAMFLDRAGWLWVGGFGLGLQRHNPNNRNIWLRGADLQAGSPLNDPSVRSLLQVDNGEIWAASQSGGVAVMDGALRVIGQLPARLSLATSAHAKDQPPVRVTAMAQTRDGSIWLGCNDTLHQFDRGHRHGRSLSTRAGMTQMLLASSDGSLWVATGDGLYLLRPSASTLQRIALRDSGLPLQGAVHVLAEAPDRSIWVGTVQGLFRIAAGEHDLLPVRSPKGADLGNASVAGLLFDRQNILWVDTGVAGLHRMSRWDGREASFERISERHGIVNRPFGANLFDDGRGRIWTQIAVYDPTTDRISNLTSVDGADLGTGWFGSSTRTSDGRLLFGGSKGVLVVRPESFEVSDYAPPLVVSELRVDGRRQSAGDIVRGLQITPAQRSFSLQFAALDYSEPLRIRYAYRLDGFDPDWINGMSNNRTASYSNLDPGQYVLRVRATNRSGIWSPNELAIAVQVQPTWWEQWWFRILVLALASFAVYGLIQLRTRRLRENQLALESKVEQRTAELQQLTEALNESSLTDPLTGLRNRRFLTMHIMADTALAVRAYENHLQHGARLPDDADLLFFMFDIDHFKQVNDQYGHAAGDAVLMQMRSRLQGVFRDSDYLVRWGGEEFLVVARGTSRQFAAELAERARGAVANTPFELAAGVQVAISCSVGFAAFPLCHRLPQLLDWVAVLNVADASLYAVKQAGRNGWLGVLDVQNDSPQEIQYWARQPIADWARAGDLSLAVSAGLTGWSAAPAADGDV